MLQRTYSGILLPTRDGYNADHHAANLPGKGIPRMTSTSPLFPFDLAQPRAGALLVAMTEGRARLLQSLSLRLAQRPELRARPPALDAARRLAAVLYGNFVAALTFGTYATFERDILWHLSLIERRSLPVTLNHERDLFRGVAEALTLELPEFAREITAICMSVVFLVESARTAKDALPADISAGSAGLNAPLVSPT